jgi:hypothetical protein
MLKVKLSLQLQLSPFQLKRSMKKKSGRHAVVMPPTAFLSYPAMMSGTGLCLTQRGC